MQQLGVPLAAISASFGVSTPSVCYWRTDRRPNLPPDGWRETLATFVRQEAAKRRLQASRAEQIARELEVIAQGVQIGR